MSINKKYKGVRVGRCKRHAIYLRDGYKCVYCGKGKDLTLDHIIPNIQNGNSDSSNLVTACAKCNVKKSDEPLSEFASTGVIKKINKLRNRPLKPYHEEIMRRFEIVRSLEKSFNFYPKNNIHRDIK